MSENSTEKKEFMKQVIIDKIEANSKEELVKLFNESFPEYKKEYEKIKNQLLKDKNSFINKVVCMTVPFGSFIINVPNETIHICGITEFRSIDCLKYTGMLINLVKSILGVKNIEYKLLEDVVFNDELTNRERRIHLFKFAHCMTTKKDINDIDVINRVKETFKKWGEDIANFEYSKDLAFIL